jgi:hypothetical protein
VATNDGDGSKVSSILENILTSLNEILRAPPSRRAILEEKLVDMCAKFAHERVKKEARIGSHAAKTCIEFLSQNHTREDDGMARLNQVRSSGGMHIR